MSGNQRTAYVYIRERASEWVWGTKYDFWSTSYSVNHYHITPWPFLATDSLWASSHHMILFLKVLFLFSFLGRNTPGREPTRVPLSQLPSNYFSFPIFPAIPLKAFLCIISPDGPNLLILLLLGYICLSGFF